MYTLTIKIAAKDTKYINDKGESHPSITPLQSNYTPGVANYTPEITPQITPLGLNIHPKL